MSVTSYVIGSDIGHIDDIISPIPTGWASCPHLVFLLHVPHIRRQHWIRKKYSSHKKVNDCWGKAEGKQYSSRTKIFPLKDGKGPDQNRKFPACFGGWWDCLRPRDAGKRQEQSVLCLASCRDSHGPSSSPALGPEAQIGRQ